MLHCVRAELFLADGSLRPRNHQASPVVLHILFDLHLQQYTVGLFIG